MKINTKVKRALKRAVREVAHAAPIVVREGNEMSELFYREREVVSAFKSAWHKAVDGQKLQYALAAALIAARPADAASFNDAMREYVIRLTEEGSSPEAIAAAAAGFRDGWSTARHGAGE